MTIIPCSLCHGLCGGRCMQTWQPTYGYPSTNTGNWMPIHQLTDADIDRIARRVVELLKADK